MGKIVDVNGVPFDEGALTEEISGPTLTGVRQVWQHSIAPGMTPERMTRILQDSVTSNDPRDFLLLANEMEELEPQYFSQIGTRKMAVEGIEPSIVPASDSAQDKKLAAFAAEVMKLDCVEESRPDLMDALAKSFSASEIVWDRSGKQFMPKELKHREGQWFLFDITDRDTLRLRDEADLAFGIPLAPYKFIVHKPKLKAGIRIRNALARVIAFTWICKAYALKDWMAFAEVFGLPIRVGKYGPSATSRDISILRRAVANIGTDAAAVIPQSMVIDFQQVGNVSGASDLFERLCTYLDKQISKVILGQTMTADDGASQSQAKVHDQVRGDIRDADCRQLERTYNRDLIKPAIDLNFGPQENYPKVRIREVEKDDLDTVTNSLSRLIPLGLKVGQTWARGQIGAPEPKPEDELLTAPGAPPPLGTGEDGKPAVRASNAAGAAPPPTTPEQQAARMTRTADPVVAAMTQPIQAMLDASSSFEEFREKLLDAYADLDDGALASLLTQGLTAANLAGRYELLLGV